MPTFSDSSCASSSACSSSASASLSSDLGALARRRLEPLRQRLLRGRDRPVDVLRGAARHLGDRLAGGRVQHLHRLALDGVDPFAPDEVLVARSRDAHLSLLSSCGELTLSACRSPSRRSLGIAAPGPGRERRRPAFLLGLLDRHDRRADEPAADAPERLGREPRRQPVRERQRGPLVVGAQDERGEHLPADPARARRRSRSSPRRSGRVAPGASRRTAGGRRRRRSGRPRNA